MSQAESVFAKSDEALQDPQPAPTIAEPAPGTFHHFHENGEVIKNKDGEPVEFKKPQRVRNKTTKEPKLYPQWNEDGTPLLGEDGLQVQGPTKQAKPKVPKVIEYELNEDGTQKLDEAGQPIPVKKVRAPKLDADGNPIPRVSNVFLDTQVLRITEAGKSVNYRPDSKRGKIFASIKDGMTVGEFYAANGGKAVAHTYLVWYLNVAQVVEIETPQV